MLRLSTAVKLMLIALLALPAIGCASKRAKQDNEALRGLVQQLTDQQSLAQAEADRLAAENAALQAQLAGAQAQPAASEVDSASGRLAAQGFDVSMREGNVVVTLPQAILFASGSATVTSSGKSKLTQLAQTIKAEFAGMDIEVQGHTDTDPIQKTKNKYKSNWELSYDRAQNVVYGLISAGIDPRRIHASAYGEHSPVASNSGASGKASNRRVEVVVMTAKP